MHFDPPSSKLETHRKHTCTHSGTHKLTDELFGSDLCVLVDDILQNRSGLLIGPKRKKI